MVTGADSRVIRSDSTVISPAYLRRPVRLCVGGACGPVHECRIGGACGPPPPFAAPLVPRYALSSGATPRMMGLRPLRTRQGPNTLRQKRFLRESALGRGSARTRGVAPEESA